MLVVTTSDGGGIRLGVVALALQLRVIWELGGV